MSSCTRWAASRSIPIGIDAMNHSGTQQIQTKRLCLRRFAAGDAPAVYAHYGSDPQVNRYVSWAPGRTPAGADTFVKTHLARYDTDPAFYGWAIALAGKVIGSIGLFNVNDAAQSAELGYSIGSTWWGKGLATEAASAVLTYAFNEVGFRRIFATYHVDNAASGRVLQKIGMHREGMIKDGQGDADGRCSDLILYGVLNAAKH